MDKLYNLDLSLGGCGGGGASHVIFKDMVIWPFNYVEQNSNLRILIGRFWEKSGVERGLGAPQFFGHLKRSLGLNFR